MPRSKLIFIGLIVLLVIFLPGYSKLRELKAKNGSLLNEIERLKKENAELSRQIYKLEKDPLYIEKKAREKMGVSKKGEIIYKVVEGEAKESK